MGSGGEQADKTAAKAANCKRRKKRLFMASRCSTKIPFDLKCKFGGCSANVGRWIVAADAF
jgi:hypothetical protein